MKKLLVVFLCTFLFSGCIKTEKAEYDLSILVFITGVISGSPTYELMVEGALEFAKLHPSVNIKVYESGYNQSDWEKHLTEMVSQGDYDIVLGSNPSLPEICTNVGRLFPEQKFIILDSHLEGNPQIRTYLYNQYEQAFFLGYLAGLISTSSMSNTNNLKRLGFLAAQEYPLLNRAIIPGFIDGARLADPGLELDRRIIGSWADVSKAAELTSAMIDSGADVFTAIAGGASQGMIRTAVDRNAYIVWFNTNAYNLAPGIIVGCGILETKKLVIEALDKALLGELEYGISKTIGIKEGYINFIHDDPGFKDHLPLDIQNRFLEFLEDMRSGKIEYTVPKI